MCASHCNQCHRPTTTTTTAIDNDHEDKDDKNKDSTHDIPSEYRSRFESGRGSRDLRLLSEEQVRGLGLVSLEGRFERELWGLGHLSNSSQTRYIVHGKFGSRAVWSTSGKHSLCPSVFICYRKMIRGPVAMKRGLLSGCLVALSSPQSLAMAIVRFCCAKLQQLGKRVV